MQLTQQQESLVRDWAAQGASLSEIQTRLADECGIRLSYLETRFLLIDLKVDLAEKPEKKPAPPADLSSPSAGDYGAAPPLGPNDGAGVDGSGDADFSDDAQDQSGDGLPDENPAAEAPGGGSVQVELDRIQRPGFAVSGSIVCSDGVKGQWGVDDYGRLALAFPDNKGYRPSAADQQSFMMRLRELLAGSY